MMLLSGFIEPILGIRFTVLLGLSLDCVAYTLMYFMDNLTIVLISMAIYGIGNAICYFSVVNNCWKYFPNSKGLINGLILSFYGGSAFIFTSIADAIINPHGIKPDEETGYYNREISLNVEKFLFIMMIICYSFFIISISLAIPFKEEETEEEENKETKEKENISKQEKLEKLKETEFLVKGTENSKEEEEDKPKENNSSIDEPICQAICSIQYIIFVLYIVLGMCNIINLI